MLCGRDEEIRTIDGLLQSACRGRSGALVLRGEAGLGKSVLLEYARSTAQGMRSLSVRGWSTEQGLAFAGLAQLVHPVQHLIGILPPAQAQALLGAVSLGPAEPTDRFAVYAATLGLLSQLADEMPLLLTIDDAHVLDTPSAEAFAFTARRLMAEGVAMLVASRVTDPNDGFAASLPSLRLSGLDEAAAAELIAIRAGVHAHRHVLKRLVRGTAGNPMALLETVDNLTTAQLTGRLPIPQMVPADIAAGTLFARRVAELAEPVRLGLLLLAVSITTRTATVLEAASIMQVPESVFAELEAAALVVFEDGGTFRFTHPLIATASHASTSPGQRRAAHRVLAAVLAGSGQADARALHLAEATLGPNETVAAALEDMAVAARTRSGYAAAVTALERAAALSETDESRARRLHAAAADAQLAGDSHRAREMLIAADGLAEDPRLRVTVAAGRSRVEAFSGHPMLAHRILRQAAQSLRDGDPLRRSELLADSAMAALLAGDSMAAVAAITEAEELVADPSATVALVTKLIKGITLLHLGHHHDGAHLLIGCTELPADLKPDGPPLEYVILAAAAMVWIGEPGTGRKMIQPVVDRLRTAGALGVLPFALYALGSADARSGRMGSARAAAAEAIELADLTGDMLWRYLALSLQAYLEALRGNAERCRSYGREALSLQRPDADYPRDPTEALGLLELSLGRYDEAIEWFVAGARSTAVAVPKDVVEGHRDLMEAYVRSGRGLNDRMVAILAELSADQTFPLDAAIAWRLRGLVAADTEFESCFSAALTRHAAINCPFETARTHLAYGERLRRAGRRVDARVQLRAALELFERLDCAVWAERTRSELTATGETVRAAAVTMSALESLTPQEYQVARAVVRGATNREAAAALFLSRKTIEYHLGNAYRKLGVRTRTQLAHQHPELRQP